MIITPIDVTCKLSWFGADLYGLLYTWIATTLIPFLLLGLFWRITGIDLLSWLSTFNDFLESHFSLGAALSIFMATTAIPAFVIVFVLRRNFIVHGEQRKIRYLCRWL